MKRGVSYDLRRVQISPYHYTKFLISMFPYRASLSVQLLTSAPESLLPTQRGYKRGDFVKIKAIDIPSSYFDTFLEFWELGDHIMDFNERYPEIPIVIKSPKNQLAIQGKISSYQESELQRFIEELRDELDNESGEEQFIGTVGWQKSKDKQYAFWGSPKAQFPKNPDFVQISTPEVQKEIEKREQAKVKTTKKTKTKPLDKGKKKKKLPKTKGAITEKQSETLARKLEMFERLYDKGIYTKSELKKKIDELLKLYGKK